MSVRELARISIFAAVYALLTVLPPLNALGYGPLQVRVAEALAVLPFIFPWAPWGLYLGCILANLGSPFLAWDLSLGAFASLAAAFLTRRMPRPILAPLPPVIVNAVLVSMSWRRFPGCPTFRWLRRSRSSGGLLRCRVPTASVSLEKRWGA